jgi:hypothetical protein
MTMTDLRGQSSVEHGIQQDDVSSGPGVVTIRAVERVDNDKSTHVALTPQPVPVIAGFAIDHHQA